MYFVMNQFETEVTPDQSISYYLKGRHQFLSNGPSKEIVANCVVLTKTFDLHVNNLQGKPLADLGERPRPPFSPVLLLKTKTEGRGTEVFRAFRAFEGGPLSYLKAWICHRLLAT